MTHGIRSIDPTMDTDVVAAIDQRLDGVADEHNVAILMAIESGSRAWGFPSPDSDYDCRFVFVRPHEEYLSPWVRRDVIETPLDATFDVNGWDLGKAIKLMAGGNAVILEWLTSKIVYRADPEFVTAFSGLARQIVERQAIAYHYVSLGRSMQKRLLGYGEEVPQKKIFYAMRPAMALRWLRMNPGEPVPPMHFPTLTAQCDVSGSLDAAIGELLEKKARTRELGVAPLPKVFAIFIESEFELAEQWVARRPPSRNASPAPEAEAFFRGMIQRFAPIR